MWFFIWSEKPKLSLVILFLSIDIEPIFFKCHPKIGIFNNSFFRIKTGESNSDCRKNVSNCDWWALAMKNFSLFKIFSFPLITIFVDKNISKQNLDQNPRILPPQSVIFWGKIKAGKKNIQTKITPK